MHEMICAKSSRHAFRHALRRQVPVLLLAVLPLSVARAQIQFEDATTEAGIDYVGESWGAAVGYVNADALPDLYVGHHRALAALLINQGNGTFEDRAFEVDSLQALPHSDQHGASFADFDNDGDADLLITNGARDPSQLLVNNGLFLSDKTLEYDFDRQPWGGRHAVWWDFTEDGLLDLAVGVQGDILQVFEQVDGGFARANFVTGHECDTNDYALFTDINFDGVTDFFCLNQGVFPQRVYDYTGPNPFVDITSLVQPNANVVDSFVADLNGDLVPEIFGPRGRVRISGAELTDADSIEAHLIEENGNYSTTTFRTTGDLTFEFHWNAKNPVKIRWGAEDRNAPGSDPGEPLTLSLSPSDPRTYGMPPFDSAVNDGIFIGYDPATETWTMVHASGERAQQSYLYTYIDSTLPISDLAVAGLLIQDFPRPPLLLRYSASTGRFEHNIDNSGLGALVKCASAVAADFDNDMDQDIYMVCRNAVSNAANMLYMNDGTGRFTLVPGAGGAEGPVGFGVGVSEAVVTTDYDMDGFVDLYVTNGGAVYPEMPYSAGGPDKLFRNLGNGNHWIELDLEGTESNRDAIGATVTVTAGGFAQRRDQGGGYHRWSQNDKRLHFGLARNTSADVEVRWPMGRIDTYRDIPANAVYRLIEGNPEPEVMSVPTTVPPSECAVTAGAPSIDRANDREMFVWQDACGTDEWRFRVTAGSGAQQVFSGHIRTNQPAVSLTGVNLEPDDILQLDTAGTEVNYRLIVSGTAVDGFILTVADDASVCLGIDSNTSTVLVGRDRTQVNLPVNLQTLGPCTIVTPVVTISDVSALESTGKLVFELTMDLAVPYLVTVDYATFDGTATAPGDYGAASGTAEFAPNSTTARIEIDLVNDTEVEFSESFGISLFDPVSAVLGNSSATGTIEDDDPGACGAPTYDPATERGLYVWQDCTSSEWFVRAVGGGVEQTYTGRVRASEPFGSVTPFNLEDTDLFDFLTDPQVIQYGLNVFNSGEDGFQFELGSSSAACLELDSPATPVFVGAQANPISTPFDLTTLGTCFPGSSDLITRVVLAGGPPRLPVGTSIVVNIGVVNEGTQANDGVTLQSPLPAALIYESHTTTQGSYDPATGLWNVGAVASGADATLSITATVAFGQEGRKFSVVATPAEGTVVDPTTAGDVLQLTLTVAARRVPVTDAGSSGSNMVLAPQIGAPGPGISRGEYRRRVYLDWLGAGDGVAAGWRIDADAGPQPPLGFHAGSGAGSGDSRSRNSDDIRRAVGLRDSTGQLRFREDRVLAAQGPLGEAEDRSSPASRPERRNGKEKQQDAPACTEAPFVWIPEYVLHHHPF